MTTTEAIKQLQTEHDLIAQEQDLDGSQFAPALLEALAMAIEALKAQDITLHMNLPEVSAEEVVEILKRNNRIELIPSGKDTNVPSNDTISRQDAINALDKQIRQCDKALASFDIAMKDEYAVKVERASLIAYRETLEYLPPAQPEQRCVNCGRTINNGGWYEDGRTRCPIEEHYALPKDGYCHLWEKVNVWNDNYPEEEVKNERFDKQTGGDSMGKN